MQLNNSLRERRAQREYREILFYIMKNIQSEKILLLYFVILFLIHHKSSNIYLLFFICFIVEIIFNMFISFLIQEKKKRDGILANTLADNPGMKKGKEFNLLLIDGGHSNAKTNTAVSFNILGERE